MADDTTPPPNVSAPPPLTSAVSVSSEALSVKVKPVAALTTAWRTTLLNLGSLALSATLLTLGYLGTISVSGVLTPTQALIWVAVVNIAQIWLRAYGVKPIVLDDRRRDDRPDDHFDDRDRR